MSVDYTIRKSRRATRIILRVDHGGAIAVVVPWRVAYRHGEAFLRQRIGWVKRVQKRQRRRVGLRSPLPEPARTAVRQHYSREAQAYFDSLVAEMAQRLRVTRPRVRISDFCSQWGSCHSKKNQLAFSWRLMVAPESVARYVAAHEVAHLREANHSQRFWQLVQQLDSGYLEARQWLSRNGAQLRL